jgi:MerR family transcriptional regulator, thiopeptide resistance regulator
MKRYTVKELAALSGVSVRTLHYYDQIGLLKPAQVSGLGHRVYGRAELLRLQQVLFYRALRLPLAQVRRLLDDPAFDTPAALKAHRRRLESEAQALHTLIRTIDKTLSDITGEHPMQDHELYEGFSPEQQRDHERFLVQRYGAQAQAHIDAAHQRMKDGPGAAPGDLAHRWCALEQRLADALDAGHAVDSPGFQALVAQHHALVSEHWTPDREAYIGLGQLYVEHPDFAARYEALRPGLAEALARAMEVYAIRSL